ncbi:MULTISPECIES: VOC family protein [unclassified Rhizobium]|uniref:2-oxoadipate dioxygenase/decarboxylase HglS n=1 Tax=unclassified Rhizobium TaxID=2613769 RepID=UPI00082844DC|nr:MULTISPECIES: VOC family protein [unclassified Rhizobium]OCI97721.1 DUF1338 domain-containing protein [Rhizobium sp. AC27/96]TIX93506.1 VOC family protein [Rhizobium sp. P44RR-XXIV]
MSHNFVPEDEIRYRFSHAMSEMYRAEVPQYGTLMELVEEVNRETLMQEPALLSALTRNDELDRLSVERHGAIRLGTPRELFNIRRVFAVMGMYPVGYYDLSVAGIPVHSTAFRPVNDESLRRNPFRVFTSLLRLELIEDEALREQADVILSRRKIFSDHALALVSKAEKEGGLFHSDANNFVEEVLETFRWHGDATVTRDIYSRLHDAHRLVADVVSFKGPHINHLTPRTLDIDAVQAGMPTRGISPKAVIEGPPKRKCAILLRQTSFKALEETIKFEDFAADNELGTHTARFGEIEQRGVALTAKGRRLYDDLLASVRNDVQVGSSGGNSGDYDSKLIETFGKFPDDWDELRKEKLAFFRYSATEKGLYAASRFQLPATVGELVDAGYVRFDPIVYEDFLPVSAAGIFQSNLGTDAQQNYSERSNRSAFENALGSAVQDELDLYAHAEQRSLDQTFEALGHPELAHRSAS